MTKDAPSDTGAGYITWTQASKPSWFRPQMLILKADCETAWTITDAALAADPAVEIDKRPVSNEPVGSLCLLTKVGTEKHRADVHDLQSGYVPELRCCRVSCYSRRPVALR